MLVEKMQAAGFLLEADRDQLIVTGILTDSQRQFIRDHKTELMSELRSTDDPLAAMRKSQPEGWGWWGYLLADGGRGSIRGPYPDEQSALPAVQAEFNQPAIRLVPLPGHLPETDSPPPPERAEIGRCKPPVVTCEICRHWTADSVNPPGGMGKCRKHYPGTPYPWHKCKGKLLA